MKPKSVPLSETFRLQTEQDIAEALRRDLDPNSAYLAALRECRLAPPQAVRLKGYKPKFPTAADRPR